LKINDKFYIKHLTILARPLHGSVPGEFFNDFLEKILKISIDGVDLDPLRLSILKESAIF